MGVDPTLDECQKPPPTLAGARTIPTVPMGRARTRNTWRFRPRTFCAGVFGKLRRLGGMGSERVRVCVCVCVRERERETERSSPFSPPVLSTILARGCSCLRCLRLTSRATGWTIGMCRRRPCPKRGRCLRSGCHCCHCCHCWIGPAVAPKEEKEEELSRATPTCNAYSPH